MLENLDEESRSRVAFQLVLALRETLSIAKKATVKPTYENAIKVLNEINPELYEEVNKILPFKNISELAQYYLASAELRVLNEPNITVLKIIDEDIEKNTQMLTKTKGIDNDNKKLIEKKLWSLEAVKESLRPRRASENRYLVRDFTKFERTDFGATLVHSDSFKVDYKLKNDTYLRIRLLHPDHMETVTGADLIYEQHDEMTDKIRVMFLQYKMWDKGVLYFSQTKNLEAQLRKMKSFLCDKGYCQQPEHLKNKFDYRFPYCSAFLRPTDKIQRDTTKLVSTGIHIPICTVLGFMDEGETSLDKKHLRTSTLTHEIFEHLFNRSFIGSRWLQKSELEEFYKETKILESDESIKIYAREIWESKF